MIFNIINAIIFPAISGYVSLSSIAITDDYIP